ncbi:MAG TPA: hypothetical protein VF192_13745 [Longimicrobiales bacterium]
MIALLAAAATGTLIERAEGLLALCRGTEELLMMGYSGSRRPESKVGYLSIGVEQDP